MGSIDGALEHVGEEATPHLAGLPSVGHKLVQLFLNILLVGAVIGAVGPVAELSTLVPLQAVEQVLVWDLCLVLGILNLLLNAAPLRSEVGHSV